MYQGWIAAFLAIVISACAPQLHVPSTVAGDVPVKLVNDTGQTLCQVRLTADGENIVGGGGFFDHKAATIKLKPGAYDIFATTVGCGGSVTGTQHLVLQQATEVHFGGTQAVATSGFVAARVNMTEQGGDAGGSPPAEEHHDDPYWDRTDCVHRGQPEGNGRCCAPSKSCGSSGCTCG
jgi:hypothetical protein